jgi:hypothetical protein
MLAFDFQPIQTANTFAIIVCLGSIEKINKAGNCLVVSKSTAPTLLARALSCADCLHKS